LNESVSNNAKGEKFITFFIGKYNAKTRNLHYINAGHNPPLHFNSNNGRIDYLNHGCMGLGMFDEIPKILQGDVIINPGDKLICYTDGLVEAENSEQKEFGVGPIEAVITIDKSIEEVINKLKDLLKDFIKDQHVTDDISILGIDFS